jgi:hypothetical protein
MYGPRAGGGGTRPRQARCYRRPARGAETTRFAGVPAQGQRQSPQARAHQGSYRVSKHLRRHPRPDRKARATGSRRAQQRARTGRGRLDIHERAPDGGTARQFRKCVINSAVPIEVRVERIATDPIENCASVASLANAPPVKGRPARLRASMAERTPDTPENLTPRVASTPMLRNRRPSPAYDLQHKRQRYEKYRIDR